MGNKLKSIRGIHDGMPSEAICWCYIEKVARKVFAAYAFDEVRLPILEPTELFVRSIGEATDIVSKEMYRFEDRGGDDLCLRPEGTAGAVRAYLQAGLTRSGIQRWYYTGPMFRRERPQKGRLRQFQQIGVELFGAAGPVEDAEVVAMAQQIVDGLSIGDTHLEINSLGCPVCRPSYREYLVTYLQGKSNRLCETCQERIRKNPMRVLDCKVESCQQELTDAPHILAHLCEDCDMHFSGLKQCLDTLSISYHVNPLIVRGLDYYNRTAFEVVTGRLGAQGTVIAGGRYDSLVEELGGPATPAVGFALGLERLAMLLPEMTPDGPDVAVVALGEDAQSFALQQADSLRKAGLRVVHCGAGSAKRLFKRADREGARFVLVVGEDEIRNKAVTLKNMQDGSQQTVSSADALKLVKKAVASQSDQLSQ
ncbi:MAG: histidine--tRNA ligase [Mariprofundaceae bacterium]